MRTVGLDRYRNPKNCAKSGLMKSGERSTEWAMANGGRFLIKIRYNHCWNRSLFSHAKRKLISKRIFFVESKRVSKFQLLIEGNDRIYVHLNHQILWDNAKNIRHYHSSFFYGCTENIFSSTKVRRKTKPIMSEFDCSIAYTGQWPWHSN